MLERPGYEAKRKREGRREMSSHAHIVLMNALASALAQLIARATVTQAERFNARQVKSDIGYWHGTKRLCSK